MKGLIVKGIGGFYYVETDIGIVEAKGRGAFKKDGISLEVGDFVEIDLLDVENKKAVINEIPDAKILMMPQTVFFKTEERKRQTSR